MLSTRLKGAGGTGGIVGLIGTFSTQFDHGGQWTSSTNVMNTIDYKSGDLVIVAFTFDSSSDSTWSFDGNTPSFTDIQDYTGLQSPGSYSGYAFLPDSSNYDDWGVTGVSTNWVDLTLCIAVFRGWSTYTGRTVQGDTFGRPNSPTSVTGSIGDLLVHIAHGEDDHANNVNTVEPSGTTLAIGRSINDTGTTSTTAIAYEETDTASAVNRGIWDWSDASFNNYDDAWDATAARFGV